MKIQKKHSPTPILFSPEDQFRKYCDQLAKSDQDLAQILNSHGYPPMWTRPANFSTLIHIILEQQVSLASARAAMIQLKARIGRITPRKLLELTDEEMRACYFSRQKMTYARHLAQAIVSGSLKLSMIHLADEELVRMELKKIKGIGDWTVDIYLMMALHRVDVFPVGDLAMLNSFRKVKKLPATTTREEILELSKAWRPCRSVAAMMLWHQYIKERNIKL